MLEKVVESLNNFAAVYQTAHESYTETRKKAEATYNERKQNEIIVLAYDQMNAKIADTRESTKVACAEVFEGIRTKVNAVISKPVSGDFYNTLEAVKAMKAPSKTELEAITEQYKGNYFAYRAICDVLGGAARWNVITVDDVLEAVASLEATVNRCISGTPSAYMFRLLVEPKGAYISSYENLFIAFCDGRFEDAAEAMKADSAEDTEAAE